MELLAQTVLITGAGTDIGRASTLALSEWGCRVVITGRRSKPLVGIAAQVKSDVLVYTLDVTDYDAVDALPTSLPDGWRDIAVFVNSAGREVGRRRHFHEGTADEWASIVITNLLRTFRVSRALVPGIVKRSQGYIVNIGSTSGLKVMLSARITLHWNLLYMDLVNPYAETMREREFELPQ